MRKILISVPGQLAVPMKIAMLARQRSKVITELIEKEIEKREKSLYKCAVAVENDKALRNEMKDWDNALQDGLNVR